MMYFWIILLAVVIWAVWYFGKRSDGFSFEKKNETPIDILKRRFANGEITEEEYNKRKLALEERED